MKLNHPFICSILMVFLACKPADKLVSEKGNTLKKEKVNVSLKEQLGARGIDYFARGNNPDWALDMDFQGNFVLYGEAFDSIVLPKQKGKKAQDGNVVFYEYGLDHNRTIFFTILKQDCASSEDADVYSYFTALSVEKDEVETDYQGCGEYIMDYRLNDIWALDKIHQEDTFITVSPRISTLELNIKTSKAMGKFICNSYTGSFWQAGEEIRFKQIAVTEMACINELDFTEKEISALLREVNGYKIEDNKLLLMQHNKTVLEYVKAD